MSKKNRNVELNNEREFIQNLCEHYNLPDYVVRKYNQSKIIILCEGKQNSFDYRIYSSVYSNAIVLPVNSNTEVIAKTKGLRKTSNIFYGIVDGDGLSAGQKHNLQNDGIYCLDVYAIENLLAIDEVILMIMQDLNVVNFEKVLDEIKTNAFCLMQQNGKHLDYDDILLQSNPKKVIGLIINAIGTNDGGWKYKETFFKLLEKNPTKEILLSHIRKYTPII